ncbi:MAG: 30S ribosomal protein S7 [Candidatus Midichloria sp.]|nr:30S ribosomal protein S7 [Candidatus Midichloria sp.]
MSRRRAAENRQHLPDAKYGHLGIAKFINNVMVGGKKSVAEKIVYDALENAANKLGVDPVELFEKVIANVSPALEVRSRRVGGATYQVPVEVRAVRAMALAVRWIIKASKARKAEKSMALRLSALFIDSYSGKGEAVKKRDDTHKMAEANKAFSHYKW